MVRSKRAPAAFADWRLLAIGGSCSVRCVPFCGVGVVYVGVWLPVMC